MVCIFQVSPKNWTQPPGHFLRTCELFKAAFDNLGKNPNLRTKEGDVRLQQLEMAWESLCSFALRTKGADIELSFPGFFREVEVISSID